MSRSARIILPHTPHHIVLRGHNRQTIFVSDDDYNYYRENLIEFKRELNCRIYAYCLMTNHVHLIIDPEDNPEMLSQLRKDVKRDMSTSLKSVPAVCGKVGSNQASFLLQNICRPAVGISN
jgi:REP element-mobilizing transposase RayT